MSVREDPLKKNLSLAQKGDERSFSFLLNTFWNDVYNYLLAQYKNENNAEEITLVTFTRAFEKINTYNANYSFKTWLIAIAKNSYLDLLRQQKKNAHNIAVSQTDEEDKTLYNIADDAPTKEDQLITEQNLKNLLACIKKLKPRYQEIINLRYFQELSYKEISEKLNEPINNVKIKLLRAKKLLAEIIQSQSK